MHQSADVAAVARALSRLRQPCPYKLANELVHELHRDRYQVEPIPGPAALAAAHGLSGRELCQAAANMDTPALERLAAGVQS